MPPTLQTIAAYLDEVLETPSTPDYPNAINGVQVANRAPIVKVAAAVDASHRTIAGAIAEGANLLLVHHGLFWSGVRPVTGPTYERLSALLTHDVAVYSAHLPLDRHPTLGNNVLLARALELEPAGTFGQFETITIGVRGHADVATTTLVKRATAFARQHGGTAIASPFSAEHRTRNWAICTGAGASADTLQEAVELGIDTLITGEGPHWTAVDAPEHNLVIIYAGHYATETLGVTALAQHVARDFAIPWTFIAAPTGI